MNRSTGYLLSAIIIALIFSIFITMNVQKGIRPEEIPKSELELKTELIQNRYPTFKTYPSNQTPKKTIKTKKEDIGWYISFVQEGSIRPVLYAKCFFVGDDDIVQTIGEYEPSGLDYNTNFSLKSCN